MFPVILGNKKLSGHDRYFSPWISKYQLRYFSLFQHFRYLLDWKYILWISNIISIYGQLQFRGHLSRQPPAPSRRLWTNHLPFLSLQSIYRNNASSHLPFYLERLGWRLSETSPPRIQRCLKRHVGVTSLLFQCSIKYLSYHLSQTPKPT